LIKQEETRELLTQSFFFEAKQWVSSLHIFLLILWGHSEFIVLYFLFCT
jgi:hypothetical protein